jgi:hypothetical protein
MRFPVFAAIALALSFPLFALADTVSGGFPSQSLWLSKTSLTEGDSVQIFAPIYDSGTGKIQGDVVFLVDDTEIGSVRFSLDAGESKIASLSWSAKEGAHTVSAEIRNASGETPDAALSLSREKTEPLSVSVAAAPPPAPAVAALRSAGGALAAAVSAAAPAVSGAVEAAFSETEALRNGAKTALEASLAADTPASAGKVLGAETENLAAAAAAPHTSFSPLRLLKQIALAVVSYEWLFYPLLLVVILFILYFFARQIARPHPVRAA